MFLNFKIQLLPTEKSVLIQKRDGFNSVIYDMFLKFKIQLLPTEKSVLIQKRDGFNSVIYGIY